MNETTCSRCGRMLNSPDDVLLAGVCWACAVTLLSLDVPAAFVARDHAVLLSNGLFQRASARTGGEPRQVRIGESLGCRSASLPGGCGQTVACPACNLRRLLAFARISGETLHGIPITLQRTGSVHKLTMSFEKAGDAVLLTIHSPAADWSPLKNRLHSIL